MNGQQYGRIASFIWNIADDVLRDLYNRGKYRDVILPMTVLRRLDAVLEPTKPTVLDMKASLDKMGVTHQDLALRQAAGQAFYNTSPFTLRDLKSRASQQQLKDDFEAFLDGFSPNVQDIFENFEFRHQIPKLSKADALGVLIEKFLDPSVNLSPDPVLNPDKSQKLPPLAVGLWRRRFECAARGSKPYPACLLMCACKGGREATPKHVGGNADHGHEADPEDEKAKQYGRRVVGG